MAKTVKMSDIAEQLNISTVTVSKALSDQKGVSDEMRNKIKKLRAILGVPSIRKLPQGGSCSKTK